jgi:hypothetical protein
MRLKEKFNPIVQQFAIMMREIVGAIGIVLVTLLHYQPWHGE